MKGVPGFLISVLLISLIIGAVKIGVSTEETYSKADVRSYISKAANCHAEFFYTHDPSVTGVGISDALRACDPFK